MYSQSNNKGVFTETFEGGGGDDGTAYKDF